MEIINDSSIFTDGKYEILYASKPYLDRDGNTNDGKAVCSLNGADVNYMELDLSCNIHWKEQGKVVDFVSFLMPRDDAKLSDVFATTPYGLIKKNRTGVGATTLELNSNRNSIVVVPTKALAYDKAKKSRIGGTNKYRVLYVGSDIVGFVHPKVDEYLEDEEIPIKKFIVVADSLPRLLNIIGEANYSKYFLMIDEIDSYQYDSSFRDTLETVLDCYWQFPKSKRSLVSATITSFSDQRIMDEAITEVQFNAPQTRNIDAVHTNCVEITTAKRIETFVQEHPNDNILIAYNSIANGIMRIIKLLPEELRVKCSVLCSIKSKSAVGEYYTEINEGTLPSQITFMTCTYFVGIDILQRFHLISISNSEITHSLLSVDKLRQIVGRCRNEDGVLSETIIYKSKSREYNVELQAAKTELIKETQQLTCFYHSMNDIMEQYPKLLRYYRDYEMEEFVKNTKKRYFGLTNEYSVIRENDGDIKPAFFVIDNILIQLELMGTLYNEEDSLPKALLPNNVNFSAVTEIVPQDMERIRREIEEEQNETREVEIERLISALRNEPMNNRRNKAAHLKMESSRFGSVFLDYFIELCDYVPFEMLTSKLKDVNNARQYKLFYNATLFFALDEEHPIKKTIKEQFVLNECYTGNEVVEKINMVWSAILGHQPVESHKMAFEKLQYFCTKKKENQRGIKGNPTPSRTYRITGYDVNDFGCEPLNRIVPSANTETLFRL